jgi:tricorn protease
MPAGKPRCFLFIRAVIVACLVVLPRVPALALEPLLLRSPSLSRTKIAFAFAGTIWTANRDGSDLRQITTYGHESRPIFSPDGSQIAFSGNYDTSGPSDASSFIPGARYVYVIPTIGGEPRQLTYHPADMGAVNWTLDGKRVLFVSSRTGFVGGEGKIAQMFSVPVAGGAPERLPLIRASEGALSPDGKRIAYVPGELPQQAWKHYRGGAVRRIWLARLSDSTIVGAVPTADSNDFNPMWAGDRVYFISDREGPTEIFYYDLKTKQIVKVVANDGPYDIKSAAICANTMIYEKFGTIHLHDLHSGQDRVLDMRPSGDFRDVWPHFVSVDPKAVRFADLSPDGQRVAVGVHGEILSMPVDGGHVRNLTNTPAVVERDPAWSPDGKSIAYFSDASGEYGLQVRPISGQGAAATISLQSGGGFYYAPTWSPDSTKVAYTDQHLNYWYLYVRGKSPVRIDTDLFAIPAGMREMAWSPDSRWIAYIKQTPNHLHAAYLYSLEQAKSFALTDGMSDVLHVAFDRSGKYLYFTASTDVDLSTARDTDMTSFSRPVTRSVYLILLRNDEPSPLLPESDREAQSSVSHSASATPRVGTEIDRTGIAQRILPLPIPARNYYALMAGQPGILYLVEGPPVEPMPGFGPSPPANVLRYDMRTQKLEPFLDGIGTFELYLRFDKIPSFRVSSDGRSVLFAKNGQWYVASAAANGGDQAVKVPMDEATIHVEPRAEWKHVFEQAVRDEQDFFYNANFDFAKMRRLYEPFVDGIRSRDDLTYLIAEMVGQLGTSHVMVGGLPVQASGLPTMGLLGADYSVDHNLYRISRIYSADPWDPDSYAPLLQPGQSARIGDYILAVDGRPVDASRDIYAYFQGKAGALTRLRVGSAPDGGGSREIVVEPVADEFPLRNFAWVEHNRQTVARLSGGRLAYVYLPDTWVGGYENFNRYYFAQTEKQGAVIDERYNGGGWMADYVIDYVKRPLLSYWYTREGADIRDPLEAIYGPKVLITNEESASGGDLLPWMFRRSGIGPIVGKRTWGGLVGFYTSPMDLLDGSLLVEPNLAIFTDKGWIVENRGVEPDFDVEDDPHVERTGRDPQLERAVEVAMQALNRNPPPALPSSHPPYPKVDIQ